MAIKIAGRAHLGEPGENGTVDHEFEVIAHHHAVVVTGLPFQDLRQCLFGGFTAGQEIQNDWRQDEPNGYRVGVGCGAHAGDLTDGVPVDARAHVEGGGDAGLMQHGEKVKHAAAKALWRKQEAELGHDGLQSVLVKMTAGPISALVHLRIGLGHTQQRPRRVVANQLMERAVPEHDRLLPKHLVQVCAPDLAVPQGVIAPADKRYGGIAVLSGERFQAGTIPLRSGLAGEFTGGQRPVIGRQKRELGEHRGQGRVHVRINESW